MTTAYSRDRTLLFLSFRSSVLRPATTSYPPASNRKGKGRAYDHNEEESTSLITGMEETIIDFDRATDAEPPRWLQHARSVEEIITKLRSKSQSDSVKIERTSLIPITQFRSWTSCIRSISYPPSRTARSRNARSTSSPPRSPPSVPTPLRNSTYSLSTLAGLSPDTATHPADSRDFQELIGIVQSLRIEEIGFDHGCECSDSSRYQGPGSQ